MMTDYVASLYAASRKLLGDGTLDPTTAAPAAAGEATGDGPCHPEYARGIVELLTDLLGLPPGSGAVAVAEALGVDPAALYPTAAPAPAAPVGVPGRQQ